MARHLFQKCSACANNLSSPRPLTRIKSIRLQIKSIQSRRCFCYSMQFNRCLFNSISASRLDPSPLQFYRNSSIHTCTTALFSVRPLMHPQATTFLHACKQLVSEIHPDPCHGEPPQGLCALYTLPFWTVLRLRCAYADCFATVGPT